MKTKRLNKKKNCCLKDKQGLSYREKKYITDNSISRDLDYLRYSLVDIQDMEFDDIKESVIENIKKVLRAEKIINKLWETELDQILKNRKNV